MQAGEVVDGASTESERRSAARWYLWLWLSPALTVPTLLALREWVPYLWPTRHSILRSSFLIPTLGSALWHLILLIPASDRCSFVRWHGRQALLLAAVRTVIPFLLLFFFGPYVPALLTITSLVVVWFFGTRWGQREAKRGQCTLLRWFGADRRLPARAVPDTAPSESAAEAPRLQPGAAPDPEKLLEIIRFGRDPRQRAEALAALERLGMVEPLQDRRSV